MKFLFSALLFVGLISATQVFAGNLSREEAIQCSWSMRGVASASLRSQPVSRVLTVDLIDDRIDGDLKRVNTAIYDGSRGNGAVLCTGEVCISQDSGKITQISLSPTSRNRPLNSYTTSDFKAYAAEAALSLHVSANRFDSEPRTVVERADFSGQGNSGDRYTVTIRDNGDRYRYEVEFASNREFPIVRIVALDI